MRRTNGSFLAAGILLAIPSIPPNFVISKVSIASCAQ